MKLLIHQSALRRVEDRLKAIGAPLELIVVGEDGVARQGGKDIANIGSLDQKLWMALAVPTRGTELDPKTADLIDTASPGQKWISDHCRWPSTTSSS